MSPFPRNHQTLCGCWYNNKLRAPHTHTACTQQTNRRKSTSFYPDSEFTPAGCRCSVADWHEHWPCVRAPFPGGVAPHAVAAPSGPGSRRSGIGSHHPGEVDRPACLLRVWLNTYTSTYAFQYKAGARSKLSTSRPSANKIKRLGRSENCNCYLHTRTHMRVRAGCI